MSVELSEKIETIHFYYESGIHVFPIEENTKLPWPVLDKNGNQIILKDKYGNPIYDEKTGQVKVVREDWKEKYFCKPLSLSETIDIFKELPNSNIGAICGIPSGNLINIDVDNPKIFERDYLNNNRELQSLVNQTWRIESASKGFHSPFHSPFPVKGQVKQKRGYDIKGNASYFLVPPSIALNKKRELGQYTFIYKQNLHSLSESEFRFLQETFNLEIIPEIETEKDKDSLELIRPHGLSWKLWEILRFGKYEKHGYFPHGHRDGRQGKSRSEAEFIIIMELAKQSYPFEWVLDVFNKHASNYSKYKNLGSRGQNYLFDSYHNALDWLNKQNQKFRETIHIYRTNSENLNWKQTSGHSVLGKNMQGVFNSIVNVMERTGKEQVSISIRELAEMTGTSKRGVSNSIEKLKELEFIQSLKAGNMTAFRICARVDIHSQMVGVDRMSTFAHTDRILREHDLFRHSVLGKTGLQIYLSISEQGMTKSELIASIGLHRTTIERKLRDMVRKGVLAFENGLYVRPKFNPEELDRLNSIARGWLIESPKEKQVKQHRFERNEYKKLKERMCSSKKQDT
jgi:DNA-binding MarR family transcriptional regulator